MEKEKEEEEKRMEIQRDLQNKYATFKTLEANLGNLSRQKELLLSRLIETQNTIVSIEEMGRGSSEMLFSIGPTAYARGKPLDKSKVVVQVGAGIALEKTAADAKKTLEKTKGELEKAIEDVQKEMERSAMVMQRLEADVQQTLAGAMSAGRQQEADDDKFKVISGG